MGAPLDPWAVLGLAPGSSVADARAARRRLAKRFHPDAGASDGADMVHVNQAVAEVEARHGFSTSDDDTFTIAALPAEAFEALFLVAYGLGEILVADEPYALEVYLPPPLDCFCTLSLAPEAGGSIVTIDLVAADSGALPGVAAVRDVLVAELRSQQTHSPGPG